MIFLNKVGSYQLVKSICYPAKVNKLDHDNIFILPTVNEKEFLSITDRLKGNTNFKIRFPKVILLPYNEMIYYKSSKKKYMNKEYQKDVKDRKNRGFNKVAYNPELLHNFNGYIDVSNIIMDTINIKYTMANSYYFWYNIIKSRGVQHPNRYLLFTKDNMLVKLLSITSVKMTNGLNSKNMYLNFLFNMRYHFDIIRNLLIEENINLIFTDYKWTVYVNCNDIPSDSKEFFDSLFLNLKKLDTGILIEEDTVVDNTMEFTDEDNSEEEIDDTESTRLIGAIEKIDNKLLGNKDTKLNDEIIEVADSKNDTKMTKEEKQIEVAKKIADIIYDSSVTNTPEVSPRLLKVSKRYNDIKEKNLSEIINKLDEKADNILSKKEVKSINGHMKEFKIYNMDSQYEKIAKKNRIEIGDTFSKATTPLFMSNYKEKDDDKSYDTKSKLVSYQFQSPYKADEKHSFTVKVPTLRDGKFLHINGSDKVMVRQKLSLPVIKLKDQVLLTSYFGKIFIKLSRGNVSKKAAKFKRFIKFVRNKYTFDKLKRYFNFTPSYYGLKDSNYVGPELLEISRFISTITTPNGVFHLSKENIKKAHHNRYYIGTLGTTNYYATANDEIEDENGKEVDILSFFSTLFHIDDDIFNEWSKIVKKKESTAMSYSEIVILSRNTPLIMVILHAFDENLIEVLDLLKKDYRLEYKITPIDNKKPAKIFNDDEGDQFIFDGFTLDIKYNTLGNRCLLQYLKNIDLSHYKSLKLKGIIEESFDSRHIMNMENYRDFFIDDVATKGILEDMGISTNYGEMLLYANALLFEYDRTIKDTSLSNERMPSNAEIIQGVLYKNMANSFIDWSNKVKRGSTTAEFSVERDAVIKELLTLPNVEESSKLNPVQHLDKLLTISGKGVSGVNEERAYTAAKRQWDKSFFGIMSDVSPYTKSSGLSMRLAVNPNINDMKGYFDSKKPNNVDASEIMSVSETLGPFAQRHDSAPRLGMGMQQFNHLTGTEGSEPALVTYGMDESIANLDTDFTHIVKDDCKVIDKNERYIKVRYDNLKDDKGMPLEEVFNIDKVERNSAKAKYILNKMELNKNLNIKPGSKIKKNSILSYNKEFYKDCGGDIVFKSGPIAYIAIGSTKNSYEDALLITEDLAHKLRSKTLKRVAVKLKSRSKIVDNAEFGKIRPNDILLKYSEDTGSDFYNEKIDLSLLDDFLLKSEKSHYDGILRDIFIYYKMTDEEYASMDSTIKGFINRIKNYYDTKYKNSELGNNIQNYEKNRVLDHVTRFRDNRKNKVNGDTVDKGDILIEFYIETEQAFTIGDKVTLGNTALKGVCSKILPSEKAPVGVKSGRRIDAILSTYSPLSRMVYSLPIVGYLTECMKKINEHIKEDILEIKK